MHTRARIVIALGLVAVAALLAVVVWLDIQDWKKLLLFGGVVGVAAWGWGRAAAAPVETPRRSGDLPTTRRAPEETGG